MAEQDELDRFIDSYSPEVAHDARKALELLSARMPTATRLVYDNYNALVIAFGPNDRAADAVLSIALYPRYVTLFFAKGAELEDPHRLLEGEGSTIRSIRLRPISRLIATEVLALVDAAIAGARVPLPAAGDGCLVIKSVSPKQRPRRPSG